MHWTHWIGLLLFLTLHIGCKETPAPSEEAPAEAADPFPATFIAHVDAYCACTEPACTEELNEAFIANPIFIQANAADPAQIQAKYADNPAVMDAMSRLDACQQRFRVRTEP